VTALESFSKALAGAGIDVFAEVESDRVDTAFFAVSGTEVVFVESVPGLPDLWIIFSSGSEDGVAGAAQRGARVPSKVKQRDFAINFVGDFAEGEGEGLRPFPKRIGFIAWV
jgi:hypothetical protein